MPLFRKSISDRLAEVVLDDNGKGSWVGHVIMFTLTAVIAVFVFKWVSDKFETRTHEKEKQEIVDRHNQERDQLLKQIQLRDADL